ncbi:MAG: hypothetical protein MRK01_06255 [Candidatus Scalindua sp.]|nr:hypothetical protein [Candidatus Scalindua sp.]
MGKLNYKKYIILSYLFVIFHGCSSIQIIDDKQLNLHNAYTITLPGEPWKIVTIDSEDLAMHYPGNDAMLAIISTLGENSLLTLDRLYKQLFIGIKKKHIVNREYKYINNQRFLHTILEGEIDDHKIKISAYIISTENIVYDIVYWSAPNTFDLSLGDFENMINSFKPAD